MNLSHALIALAVLIAGCTHVQRADRDIFSLGNDFNEISRHAQERKETPDLDMLLRVKLPPNPTRGEMINYINIIYVLSRNQRTYLDSDPQVGMLTELGRANIDLILQASKPGVQWTRYGIEAISILAKDEDKEFILAHLRSNHELSKVVFAKGWCREAEEILSDIVASSVNYLPAETIECLASSKNPVYYPILIRYMTDGWNSHVTYNLIKNLPGIDLGAALQKAWEKSRGNNYQIGYLTEDTLATGYLPAFHFLFETIDDNYHLPSTIYSAESLVRQFTYQTGSKQDLKVWYKNNKESIVFDADVNKYVAAKASKHIIAPR